jgi:histidinol-phosphate aminotransferase
LSSYVRKIVKQKLKKYKGGEQKLPTGAIKLNQNENEYATSPRVISALISYLQRNSLNRYPEQDSRELKEKLSAIYKVKREQIVVGNGSDEVIATLFRTVVNEGDLVVSTNPTYGMFRNYSIQMGANYVEVELQEDFTLPVDELIEKKAKVTAVTNPNSPTGVFTAISELGRLAEGLTNSGILLIDEAYVAFASDNALRLIDKYDNILIVRTLSKSYSLAGIRVGFGIGNKNLVEWMDAVRDPYNIGTLHQIAAITALEDTDYVRTNVDRIIKGRKFLTNRLTKLGFKVYPSEANYVFFKCKTAKDARNLEENLRSRNIYVRYFGENKRISDCLRITVSTPKINAKVISTIEEIIKR